MVSVVYHMLSLLEFTFKASFACPYVHTHTSATMENLAAAQNLLGLFRARNNKVIMWCCAALLALGHLLCLHHAM